MERNWSAKVTVNWNKWLRKQCPCSFKAIKTIHTECCHNAVCKLTIASITSVKYRLIVTLPARETVYMYTDMMTQMHHIPPSLFPFWLSSPSPSPLLFTSSLPLSHHIPDHCKRERFSLLWEDEGVLWWWGRLRWRLRHWKKTAQYTR